MGRLITAQASQAVNNMLNHFPLAHHLTKQRDDNRYRKLVSVEKGVTPTITLDGKDYVNFASNDYLGLANAPALVQHFQDGIEKIGQIGSGASHLITGHSVWHDSLAKSLAQATGFEAALTFSTGYMANVGVIQALANKDTVIFSDKLNHASIVDGAILSRAKVVRFNHRDYDQLENLLRQHTAPQKLIITDHIFSMDGTIADLSILQKLAANHACALMVDDAHGFGLPYQAYSPFQPRFAMPQADIYVGTFGKAIGTSGAFVAGSSELIDYLINFARPYIYTTALPPVLAYVTEASVKLTQTDSSRADRLLANIDHLVTGLSVQGWQVGMGHAPCQTAIIPVLVGDNALAIRLAETLKSVGFWVSAIRPPTVPVGMARLRFCVSANHTSEHIDDVLAMMKLLRLQL